MHPPFNYTSVRTTNIAQFHSIRFNIIFAVFCSGYFRCFLFMYCYFDLYPTTYTEKQKRVFFNAIHTNNSCYRYQLSHSTTNLDENCFSSVSIRALLILNNKVSFLFKHSKSHTPDLFWRYSVFKHITFFSMHIIINSSIEAIKFTDSRIFIIHFPPDVEPYLFYSNSFTALSIWDSVWTCH